MEELGAKQENAFQCQVESTADFSLQNPTTVALQEQNSYCSKESVPAVRSSFPSLFVMALSSEGPRCKEKSPAPTVCHKQDQALVSGF